VRRRKSAEERERGGVLAEKVGTIPAEEQDPCQIFYTKRPSKC
jgi:hypothetical protein